MVIGRGRLREHPNQHLFALLLRIKYGGSHVTSGDVTSGQACAMVRSSGSSAKYPYTTSIIFMRFNPSLSLGVKYNHEYNAYPYLNNNKVWPA